MKNMFDSISIFRHFAYTSSVQLINLINILRYHNISSDAKANFNAFESYSHSSLNCKPKPFKHYHQVLYFMCYELYQAIEVENYVQILFIPPGLESNQSMEI